jgi:hypothetical protein
MRKVTVCKSDCKDCVGWRNRGEEKKEKKEQKTERNRQSKGKPGF